MKRYNLPPNPGGKLDQPAIFIDAVDVIEEELSKVQKIVQARQRAKFEVKAMMQAAGGRR